MPPLPKAGVPGRRAAPHSTPAVSLARARAPLETRQYTRRINHLEANKSNFGRNPAFFSKNLISIIFFNYLHTLFCCYCNSPLRETARPQNSDEAKNYKNDIHGYLFSTRHCCQKNSDKAKNYYNRDQEIAHLTQHAK